MNPLAWLLFVVSLSLGPATLMDGRCSHCKRLGVESRVILSGVASCTAVYCGGGHYDEKGRYVAPPKCNSCTAVHECTRGHQVVETYTR